MEALPDTGADISVGGIQLLDEMCEYQENLLPANEHPKAANGAVIRSVGVLPVRITLGDVTVEDEIHILPSVTGLLLSWRTTRDLHITPADYPRQIRTGERASPAPSARPTGPPGPARLATLATSMPQPSEGAAPPAASEPPGGRAAPSVARPARPPTPPVESEPPHRRAAPSVAQPPTPSAGQTPAEMQGPRERAEFPDVVREFPTVFDGTIRSMPGENYKIHLKDDAVPFCVTAPRRVPLAYREPLKEELQRLQDQDIIFPVTDPTDWCAPIVVNAKKGGGIRLCVDLSMLNKHVRRERYQSPTPAESVASIAGQHAQWFTVVDAAKGYHQCLLADECRLLTTFTTPFGRFAFKRAPYGITSISEHYNRRMEEALQGLPGPYRRVVDDVVIFSDTLEEHVQHVREFLSRCETRGISLNLDKLQLAQRSVQFAGFVLTPDGYGPNPQLTESLSAFPTPTNISELRSFFGLVNQLASFVDNIAELMEPLRPLLSPKNDFRWEDHHQRAFEKAKTRLTSVPPLGYFDPTRPTTIATDASRKKGLGFVLRQADGEGRWHVIQAGSRFLSDAETRYATIELEALAVCWALQKCRLFICGLPSVEVLTDHRPLVPILNSKTLDEIENPRLQRLKLRMSEFAHFTATWVPSSQHTAADALSRSPIARPEDGDECGEDAAAASVRAIIASELQAHHADVRLEEVRQAVTMDPVFQMLITTIQDGFPDTKSATPDEVKRYWPVRDRLTVDNGVVLCGCRVVIPTSLRKQTLQTLHAGHLGKERTKSRARQIVYWPGIDNDIDNFTRQCERCQSELPSQQRETLISHKLADRPFQYLDVDIASHAGGKYLVVVDGFSGWRHVGYLGRQSSTSKVITTLLEVFRHVGVAEALWSDGGPEFTSYQFREFMRKWGISHHLSSPHYPQSNGRAESGVKAAKKLLRKCWDVRRERLDDDAWTSGILQHWNTPGSHGASPAQIVYGRPIRDTLPTHPAIYENLPPPADFEDRRRDQRQITERRYNSRARDLPEFPVGTHVRVQDPRTHRWERCGTVIAVGSHRRYRVRFDDGGVVDRNRCHLRRRYAVIDPDRTAPRSDTQDVATRNGPSGSVSSQTTPRAAPYSGASPLSTPRDTAARGGYAGRETDNPPAQDGPHRSENPPALRRSTRTRRQTQRFIAGM